METKLSKLKSNFKTKSLYTALHILILLLSIFLVVCISIDSFHNEAFYEVPRFMKVQFWICVIFLADFFIEFFLSKDKWQYLKTHFLFFLVSIPYNSIITHYGWTFDPQLTYCLRYIPLIRGGYAMSIVVSWFTYNKATGLFISYLATLLFTIYFASLAFYLFEHGVNSLVVNYDDALWWAFMDATTVGSNIVAVTTVGRILSVLLAALGMMMFPIFTVYVTNILTKHHQIGQKYGEGAFTTPLVGQDSEHINSGKQS
ncbi:MAG: potassium channel family protein, partial [Muribaculaceae bacterium]|nr:potassium channel family protein [Muribaculaceae bacterium]